MHGGFLSFISQASIQIFVNLSKGIVMFQGRLYHAREFLYTGWNIVGAAVEDLKMYGSIVRCPRTSKKVQAASYLVFL